MLSFLHCDIIVNCENSGPLSIINRYEHLLGGGKYMSHPIIRELEQEQMKDSIDQFNVGDTVRVHSKIVDGENERIQVFEGTVLKIQNGGVRTTFTVRRLSYGVGVEKTWPIHSPRVVKVEVVRRGKVRRAKLFYLRDRVGKKAKVREDLTYTNRMLQSERKAKEEAKKAQEEALEVATVEDIIEEPMVDEVVEETVLEEVIDEVSEEENKQEENN